MSVSWPTGVLLVVFVLLQYPSSVVLTPQGSCVSARCFCVPNEDSEQTARIRIFTGRICNI